MAAALLLRPGRGAREAEPDARPGSWARPEDEATGAEIEVVRVLLAGTTVFWDAAHGEEAVSFSRQLLFSLENLGNKEEITHQRLPGSGRLVLKKPDPEGKREN